MSSSRHAVHARLLPRDLQVLADLQQFRLLTTRQIQRLRFPHHDQHGSHLTQGGATKACMRVMRRLLADGLVTHLTRQIGGVRRGSAGYVWQLTSTGDGILRYRAGSTGRTRYLEPSAYFIDHTLAIAETAVRLHELDRAGHLELLQLETEPACWREYTHLSAPSVLKPDLFAVTATGDYEDRWFLEIDLDSEHRPRIQTKSRAYMRYAATGRERRSHGVFPAIVWISPTRQRATTIQEAIRDDPALDASRFASITVDEFTDHILRREKPPD